MLLLQGQQTPLHLSARNGHVDIVNVLIFHRANIHVTDDVSKIVKSWGVIIIFFGSIELFHHDDSDGPEHLWDFN